MKISYKGQVLCDIDELFDYDDAMSVAEISNVKSDIEQEDIMNNDENVNIIINLKEYPIIIKSIDDDEVSFIWKGDNPFSLDPDDYFSNKYYDSSIDFAESEKAVQFELHKDLKKFYMKTGLRKLNGLLKPNQIKTTENWGQWFLEYVNIELFGIENKDHIEKFIEEKFKEWTGGYDFGHRIWIGNMEDRRGDMLILFNNDTGKIEWLDTEYGGFGNLDEDPNGILANSIDELIKTLGENKKESIEPLSPDKDSFYEIKKLFGIGRYSRFGCSPYDIEELKESFEILPKVLIDYYLELGEHEALNFTQDNLISPEEIYMSDSGYLVFYEENQKSCIWGIKEQDLFMDNPPVYMAYDEDDKFIMESGTLSEFFTIMAYMQGSFGLPYTCDEIYEIEEHGADMIRKQFKNKGVSMKAWINVEFYGNSETEVIALIKNDDYYNVSFGSRIKNEFNKIDEVIRKL